MNAFLDSLGIHASTARWIVAAAYALGGFLLGAVLSWISKNILRRISAKTKNHLDDILLAVVERPVVLAVTTIGLRLAVLALEPGASLADWTERIYAVVMTLVVAWAATKGIDSFTEAYVAPLVRKTEGDLDDQLLPIVRKGLNALAWILAVLVALKNVGYDVGALLAGLGIGGVAVALAAKDSLSNFFGSVAVFVDRPFKINDRIKINGIDGTVVDIGIRTSRIKTLENRVVTLPNALFAASPIENVSSEPSTKVVESLDLARSAGAAGCEKAISALKAAVEGVEGAEAEVLAGLSGFSDLGYRLSFVFYVKKGAAYLDTVSAVNLAALRGIEAAGLELAAPPRVSVEPAAMASAKAGA